MDNNKIEALINLAFENPDDYSLSNTYSGRFMYGERCLSLSTRDRYVLSTLEEQLESLDIPMGRVDSMGMGLVIYWPGTKIDLEEEYISHVWEKYCENYERRTGYEIY